MDLGLIIFRSDNPENSNFSNSLLFWYIEFSQCYILLAMFNANKKYFM